MQQDYNVVFLLLPHHLQQCQIGLKMSELNADIRKLELFSLEKQNSSGWHLTIADNPKLLTV